jgi:hypothetical protein
MAKISHSEWSIGLFADPRQTKSFAQREADKPMLPSKPQESCDIGLFSDAAAQLDLVDMVRKR